MTTDAFFGPVKATVQAACGQKRDAKTTMSNFKEANPVCLAVRGAYHGAKGVYHHGAKSFNNHETKAEYDKGLELSKRSVKNSASIVNGVVNAMPLVGHVKGGIHYAFNDRNGGDKAMKSASRSSAGLAGAAAGFVAGSTPGAVAGYVAGVNAADGVISAVDSKVHGRELLHGNVAVWAEAASKPTIGNVMEVLIANGVDVFGGIGVGGGIAETLGEGGGEAAIQSPESSGGAEGSEGVAGGGDPSGIDAGVEGDEGADAGVGADGGEVGKAGEKFKFFGDEIKFFNDFKEVVAKHFKGGVLDGIVNIGDLGEQVRDIVPDDLKIPDADVSVGETYIERLRNLKLLATKDPAEIAKLAFVPDNKRDWVQDVAEGAPTAIK